MKSKSSEAGQGLVEYVAILGMVIIAVIIVNSLKSAKVDKNESPTGTAGSAESTRIGEVTTEPKSVDGSDMWAAVTFRDDMGNVKVTISRSNGNDKPITLDISCPGQAEIYAPDVTIKNTCEEVEVWSRP